MNPGWGCKLHWPIHYLCWNPLMNWVNDRRRGTSGDIQFTLSKWVGSPVEIWDMAVGCPRCGWNDW